MKGIQSVGVTRFRESILCNASISPLLSKHIVEAIVSDRNSDGSADRVLLKQVAELLVSADEGALQVCGGGRRAVEGYTRVIIGVYVCLCAT